MDLKMLYSEVVNLPRLINRFNAMPLKILTKFFVDINNLVLKNM